MNDIAVLERCVAITGKGTIRVKNRANSTDSRGIKSRYDTYGWRLDGNAAVDVIRAIYPYLIAKRKQACIAFTLSELNKSRVGRNVPVDAGTQEKKAKLKELINLCNQRLPVDVPNWVNEPKSEVVPGWIVRSVIIWHKPAPMPASISGWRWVKCRVKQSKQVAIASNKFGMDHRESNSKPSFNDGFQSAQWSECPGCKKCEANNGLVLRRGSWRPTSSYEPILMLAKSAKYFCDGDAVKQPPADSTVSRDKYTRVIDDPDEQFAVQHDHETVCDGANLRDVWKIKDPLMRLRTDLTPEQRREVLSRLLAAGL